MKAGWKETRVGSTENKVAKKPVFFNTTNRLFSQILAKNTSRHR
jgi:hypothetical protein